MEHRIAAPTAGTLTALHAVVGQQVEVGALLAVVREEAARDGDAHEPPEREQAEREQAEQEQAEQEQAAGGGTR